MNLEDALRLWPEPSLETGMGSPESLFISGMLSQYSHDRDNHNACIEVLKARITELELQITNSAIAAGKPNIKMKVDLKDAENIHCPVCGYYCLGNGGVFCIDKPSIVGMANGGQE